MKPGIAFAVFPFFLPVNAAVKFYDKTVFMTVEICDVVAYLMLPPEFQSKKSSPTQQLPHNFLCWGLLSPQFQMVHIVQVTDIELSLLANSGTHVTHCPESNLKLASGHRPTQRLQSAGISVALGADCTASNNDLDMITRLRTSSLVGKLVDHDATA